MPCAPHGVKGFDGDDDDDVLTCRMENSYVFQRTTEPLRSGSRGAGLLYPEDERDTTFRNISDHQTLRRHIPNDLILNKHLKSRMTIKLGLSGNGEFLGQMTNSKLRKGCTSTSLGVT